MNQKNKDVLKKKTERKVEIHVCQQKVEKCKKKNDKIVVCNFLNLR